MENLKDIIKKKEKNSRKNHGIYDREIYEWLSKKPIKKKKKHGNAPQLG